MIYKVILKNGLIWVFLPVARLQVSDKNIPEVNVTTQSLYCHCKLFTFVYFKGGEKPLEMV